MIGSASQWGSAAGATPIDGGRRIAGAVPPEVGEVAHQETAAGALVGERQLEHSGRHVLGTAEEGQAAQHAALPVGDVDRGRAEIGVGVDLLQDALADVLDAE